MNRTDIEYLDYTWNPIAMRCTPISEGCAHCWHIRMANRFAGNKRFPDNVRAAYAGKGSPVLIQERLEEPSKLRKPSRIGVQFMGDLFHEDVPFDRISQIAAVMQKTQHHTFLVLTKRPRRMLEWLVWSGFGSKTLPNIWLGVTAENQQRADERIPLLLQCPAAVRFVSIEPMLGPINLEDYWGEPGIGLDWVICGGETGPGARAMDADWARNVQGMCYEVGVPYFFKKMAQRESTPPDLEIKEWPTA